MDSLLYASVNQLAEAIRRRVVSSKEIVYECLQRIDSVNSKLNAVVQLVAKRAVAEARAADDALARGNVHGPLHGVPFTVKDSFETEGVISTAGTIGLASHIPAIDATVVARLRSAGGILLGKTNTSELTLAAATDNLLYGRTNNPYDGDRIPGGSSGGSAAIVAAGGSPLDIGSDAGGSIRLPAHHCGIVGIKPTAGLVPRTGHILFLELGAAEPFNHIGPMARFVEDLKLTLPIIAGIDGCDPSVVPVPIENRPSTDLKTLHIAHFTGMGAATPSSDIISAMGKATSCLSQSGCHLKEDMPADFLDSEKLWHDIFLADGGQWIEKLIEKLGTTQISPLLRWTERQKALSAAAQTRCLISWSRFCSRCLAFWEKYDAILCPVDTEAAPAHGNHPSFCYTFPLNLLGWPAAVVRCGTSANELPIGLQVISKPWQDKLVLDIAHHLESEIGGWKPPPI